MLFAAVVALALTPPRVLATSPAVGAEHKTRYAFVTLASGSHILLGARTLARSIDRVGSLYPKVLLLTYASSGAELAELRAEGWDARMVSRLPSPFNDRGEMTRNTFSVLWAFSLDSYERVLYIDADMIVLRPLDYLFELGEFCACSTTREKEGRFNGGLMVITPSAGMFQDIRSKAYSGNYTSYNSGVQGFLNAVIPEWCAGRKGARWAEIGSRGGAHRCTNLPRDDHWLAVRRIEDVTPGTRSRAPYWWPPGRSAAELWSTRPLTVHFNHPVFWAVKPWLWLWYPVQATHWGWWQVRREVPGEAERAAGLLLRSCAAALAASCAFAWGGGALPGLAAHARRRLRRLSGGPSHRAGAACFDALWRASPRRVRLRIVAVSVLASLGIAAALPSQADALVAWAWASYFALKGSALGIGGHVVSASAYELSMSTVGSRLRCVAAGHACAALEFCLIWAPQVAGLLWISDRLLSPICSQKGEVGSVQRRLYDSLDCTNTLWAVIAAICLVGLACEAQMLSRAAAAAPAFGSSVGVAALDEEAVEDRKSVV